MTEKPFKTPSDCFQFLDSLHVVEHDKKEDAQLRLQRATFIPRIVCRYSTETREYGNQCTDTGETQIKGTYQA